MGRAFVREISLVTVVVITASLAACQHAQNVGPAAPKMAAMIRTELFFGHDRPDGSEISEAEWDEFVLQEITPRFPNGFTVVEARGQWRDAQRQIMRESTRVVIILHAPGDAPAAARIEEIRHRFKSRFNQEAVLRADSPARVSF